MQDTMMKKLLPLVLALPALCFGATATFTADTTTDLKNPERGWYLLTGSLLDSSSTFDANLLAIRDDWGFRLAFANTTLPTSTISSSQLSQMSANFAQARSRGLKLILRFQYGSSPNDPSLSQIQANAAQLKPYLYANRDVIAVVQAGMLGAYGEWADSGSGNDTKAGKRTIKEAVMDMVPPEVPINFTQIYPVMEDWYAGQAALSASEAFNGGKKARAGFHSDCYLTGNGDSYFYTGPATVKDFAITSSRTAQRAYVAAATEYVPFGGETCNNSQGASAQQRTGCTDSADESGLSGGIMNEGPRYHLNYLNNSFAPNYISAWKSGGCYTNVTNRMGYRFQFDSLSHADSVSRGGTLSVMLDMRNYGWSRIFQERRVKVTLVKSGASDITCVSANDLRELPSQANASSHLRVQCAIPSGATAGSYAMYLSMPDKSSSLSAVRAFAIRPANANSGAQAWDDSIGRFATGTAVTVN